ncbi:Interleukin-1 receptor-associated kinase 1-binding-like protein 1 [Oryzias melastigma]|uniref:Interleukin-1 receptor-associated kinase 1-binding-like protein 1 n=1 Tax=Oryzias melastigma TaxID=30732 RepID=A0A834CTJ8_ORYME|nr:Interleukin-1 receptor-associated kinase 1-binding-like protein 1 [Oryzias melastigma]
MSGSNRVVAVIPAAAGWEFCSNDKETELENRSSGKEAPNNRVREVRVTGTAEVSSPADRASVRVNVSNSKESVNEVTNSVSRRLEYILQALRQHGIRDEDTSVRRFLQRDADVYRMDAEILATFSDFEKMEQIRSILLEKLDRSVFVGTPQFFHSPESLSGTRRRACVLAVENAQQKAREVGQLLGQSLGPPLLVKEETAKEWRSEEEEGGGGNQSPVPLPRLPHIPTVTARSTVSASFSFRDKSRKKL